MYSVWDVHLNTETKNWDGREWVVDGERGRDTFPGDWTKEKAVRYYRNRLSIDHKEEAE